MTSDVKRMLVSHGIVQNLSVRVRHWLLSAVIAVVVLGLIYWIALIFGRTGGDAAPQPWVTLMFGRTGGNGTPQHTWVKDVLQISILITGFAIGYVQWRLARYEVSLEKYYDRLDVADKRLGTLIEQAWSRTNPEAQPFSVYENPPRVGVLLFDIWVFAELYNLEYVIQKYRRGYTEHEQVCRGLHTFRARCENDPEFLKRAVRFCSRPNYHDSTRIVVKRIESEMDDQKHLPGIFMLLFAGLVGFGVKALSERIHRRPDHRERRAED